MVPSPTIFFCEERRRNNKNETAGGIYCYFFPSSLNAFCGDFGLGVAPGFGAIDWMSKSPYIFAITLLSFAPLIFFVTRFVRKLRDA